MADWRHALSVFRDRLGYVMGRAPNNFPIEDYLPPDKQMNLERAYDRLRLEFQDFVEAFGSSPETAEWHLAIEDSYQFFKKGESLAGKQRLNQLYNSLRQVKKKKG